MLLEGFFTLFSNILLFTSRIENSNSFPHPLSPEKEKEYIEKFQKTRDIEARNILVKHNLRLVVYIAKKYVNYPDNEELVSVGILGLMKAINTFDASKGSTLVTYASRCIENEIRMTMRAYKKRSQDVSIFESLGVDKNGNERPIIDQLHTDEESVYTRIEDEFLTSTVQNLMTKYLTKREIEVLSMRVGLNGKTPQPQRIVAKTMNISRSYISRIESKALKKLRDAIEKEKLQL